jgi:hypothetical protein
MMHRCGTEVGWTLEDACEVSVQQILSDTKNWRQWQLPTLPKEIEAQLLKQLHLAALAECGGRMQ